MSRGSVLQEFAMLLIPLAFGAAGSVLVIWNTHSQRLKAVEIRVESTDKNYMQIINKLDSIEEFLRKR